jgi:hypothetical protein
LCFFPKKMQNNAVNENEVVLTVLAFVFSFFLTAALAVSLIANMVFETTIVNFYAPLLLFLLISLDDIGHDIDKICVEIRCGMEDLVNCLREKKPIIWHHFFNTGSGVIVLTLRSCMFGFLVTSNKYMDPNAYIKAHPWIVVGHMALAVLLTATYFSTRQLLNIH